MNRISFLNRGYAFKGLLAVITCKNEEVSIKIEAARVLTNFSPL